MTGDWGLSIPSWNLVNLLEVKELLIGYWVWVVVISMGWHVQLPGACPAAHKS